MLPDTLVTFGVHRWPCQYTHFYFIYGWAMFVERQVSSSALFTFLVRWHANVLSLHLGDITQAHLACPLNDVIFCLHMEWPTYLSTNFVGGLTMILMFMVDVFFRKQQLIALLVWIQYWVIRSLFVLSYLWLNFHTHVLPLHGQL